jgi:dipeptidyl aminopeptidase/acylaminoacyl peptidase
MLQVRWPDFIRTRYTRRMVRHLFLASVLVLSSLAAEVPSNLTAENLPPIPDELRADVGRYLEFRSAAFQGWHPKRRDMLITTRFADSMQLHLVKKPGGARRQMTFLPEPVSGGSFQPKVGGCIVFAQDNGGGEFYQLYRLDLDGKITLLTDGKSRNTGAHWARSGKVLAYTSTRRTGKDNDIRVMNPLEPGSDREVFQVTGGGWSPLDWSRDEKKILLGEYISANESRLHVVDLATGNAELITPAGGEKVLYAGGQFSADNKAVITSTDNGAEFQRLARIDLTSKVITILTPQVRGDIDDFDLSQDGTRMAYVTNEQGASVLHIMDVPTLKELPLPKLPLGVISRLSWHEDSSELAFGLNSARSPMDVWSLKPDSGELERWTESETGGLDATKFSEPEIVHTKSFDGLAMSGFVYRPDAKKFSGKRPCLVVIHGGPEGQSQPTFQARYNYFINELGIALFLPNVRGSSGYGKTFLTLDNGMKREESVRDIGSFLDVLQKDAQLDGERFAVMGGSYGGYMTLASMIHHGSRFRCGVDVVGISNFLTFLKSTQDYRRDLRRVEYGDERDPAMAEYLEKISPMTRVSEIKRPLFVVQGKNDPRVPVGEAKQIVDAVRKAGGTVSYLEAADEGHGFQKKKNADFLFLATVQFLREHLLK